MYYSFKDWIYDKEELHTQIIMHKSQYSYFKTIPKEVHSEIFTYFNLEDLNRISLVNRFFRKESIKFLKKFIDGAVFLIEPESQAISFTKEISDHEEIRYKFCLRLPHPLCDGSYSDYDSDEEDTNQDYFPMIVNKENIDDIFFMSAYLGCGEAVKLLLLHENVDVNFKRDGKSILDAALHFASNTNSVSVARLLLQNGADPKNSVNNIQKKIETEPGEES